MKLIAETYDPAETDSFQFNYHHGTPQLIQNYTAYSVRFIVRIVCS
jgi:hypothetical protein